MAAIPRGNEVNRLAEYAWHKARWIREHPNATPREYEQFIKWITRRLGI